MAIITPQLHTSELDLDLVIRLYEKVPTPTFLGQRVRFPSLALKIRTISPFWNESEIVFRAEAGALGFVGIETQKALHSWILYILDWLSS